MSGSKSKTSNTPGGPVTRGGATTVASKLAKMAAASSDATSSPGLIKDSPDILSSQLVAELEKQRVSFWEDVSALIQESVKPLQASVDALHETVGQFNGRLVAAGTLAGENFERITCTENTVKMLQAQNKSLLDRLDDLENRSRRANLRIINIPEGSEKGRDPIEFISDLLMENLGPDVLPKPPELERAHHSLAAKPGPGGETQALSDMFSPFSGEGEGASLGQTSRT